MKIEHVRDYVSARASEYPSIYEFIDAMYWSVNGDESKLIDYYDKCKKVKQKFPKE